MNTGPEWPNPIANALVEAYSAGRMTARQVVAVCDAIDNLAWEVRP